MHKSMNDVKKIIVIRKSNIFLIIGIALLCLVGLIGINKVVPTSIQGGGNQEYVILATNDLGMHCIQKDYKDFLILPPANNICVQVFKRTNSSEGELVTKGIIVRYEIVNNTTSADKNNFWEYAKDYGYNVRENIGITGNGLKGEMRLSSDKKYYEATAVPVVPYTDSDKTTMQPYQRAKITVVDEKSNKVLAVTDSVVIPVSDELECGVCHGTENTNENILKAHDSLAGTKLVDKLNENIRFKCSDCHKDNALGESGKEGVPPLSEAMHGFHANKMYMSKIEPACYSCHPGPVTQCYRGQMAKEGITCDNAKCHGTMQNVADTQKAGREAWLQEPDCGNCHGATYASNPGVLYKNSYLQNAPGEEMNNLIRCQSCHNSTHAEWVSTLDEDNLLPESILGYKSFINKCSVCHQGNGKVHQNGE